MTETPGPARKRAVLAGLDAAAVSLPMTLGGSVIVYSQVAPEWLGYGILAGCLGIVLVHAMTAHIRRPVMYGARFFEAATLAAMVQQLAERSPTWGLESTPAVRIAMVCIMVALAGVVVGMLWLARAERFARFIPAPVYVGFTNSVAVALVISQTHSLWLQTWRASPGWHVLLLTCSVVFVALFVRRWRPSWPPAAIALLAGSVMAIPIMQIGFDLPMLTAGVVWMLPVQLADFGALWGDSVKTTPVLLSLGQNAAILGVLMFLNTVVTGQTLAQLDDRQGMRVRDKLLQAAAMAFSGAAGASPVSGSPNVSLVAARTSTVTPLLLWTVALVPALIYSTQALAWIPLAALTGVFLSEAWNSWDRPTLRHFWDWLRRRPVASNARQDMVVIGGVMAASLLVNMVAALFTGLLLGLVLHAYRNSSRPVRQMWSGREISSNCARTRAEVALLGRHGNEIKLFQLDSSQFFVTAEQLSATIKSQLPGAHSAILDWSVVRNIDTSLTMTLARLESHAAKEGVLLIHAGTELEQGDVQREFEQHLPHARLAPDLDRGLELAENRLIDKYRHELDPISVDSPGDAGFLQGLSAGEQALVMQYMTLKQFAVGEALVTRGQPGHSVLLVLEGTGSVLLALDNNPAVRLAGVRSGTLVGEVAFMDGKTRAATVVAESPMAAMVLERKAFDSLSEQHPRIAQRLLMNMSLDLASRLRNSILQAAARRRNTLPTEHAEAELKVVQFDDEAPASPMNLHDANRRQADELAKAGVSEELVVGRSAPITSTT
jgi:sulfate permease, SulP family